MKNKLRFLLNQKFLSFALLIAGLFILSGCGKLVLTGEAQKTDDYFRSLAGCWTCQLFRITYETCGLIVGKVYENIRVLCLNLLGLGLGFWLLLRTLKFFLSARVPNYVAYWVEVFGRLAKAACVGAALFSIDGLYSIINWMLEPAMMFFLQMATSVIEGNSGSFRAINESVTTNYPDNVIFSPTVGVFLENLIYRTQVAFQFGSSLGLRMLVMGDLTGLVMGGFVFVLFFMLSLFFPYYFLDCIIRLGFTVLLFPLFMVAWVFPSTASWMSTGIKIIIGSLIQIVVMCIFVAISVATIESFAQLRGYELWFDPVFQDANPYAATEITRMSVTGLSFIILVFYLYELAKGIHLTSAHLSDTTATAEAVAITESVKAATKAVVYASIAIGAAVAGAAPVATAMRKRAQAEAESAVGKAIE